MKLINGRESKKGGRLKEMAVEDTKFTAVNKFEK